MNSEETYIYKECVPNFVELYHCDTPYLFDNNTMLATLQIDDTHHIDAVVYGTPCLMYQGEVYKEPSKYPNYLKDLLKLISQNYPCTLPKDIELLHSNAIVFVWYNKDQQIGCDFFKGNILAMKNTDDFKQSMIEEYFAQLEVHQDEMPLDQYGYETNLNYEDTQLCEER